MKFLRLISLFLVMPIILMAWEPTGDRTKDWNSVDAMSGRSKRNAISAFNARYAPDTFDKGITPAPAGPGKFVDDAGLKRDYDYLKGQVANLARITDETVVTDLINNADYLIGLADSKDWDDKAQVKTELQKWKRQLETRLADLQKAAPGKDDIDSLADEVLQLRKGIMQKSKGIPQKQKIADTVGAAVAG